MALRTLSLPVAAALLATAAIAQVPPLLPFQRHQDLLVVDSSFDGIWRLADLNQDGDYNDPGEQLVYYSDAINIVLTNPTCITCADDGTVYIADSTVDIILALRDQNGDGDANDPGEFRICCNSVANGSGLPMASIQGLTVDGLGRLWAANNANGSPPLGSDGIYQMTDLNSDGDFDDAGEIVAYCTIPNGGGAVGNSIPTKVWIGPDANVYYAEVGSTGVVTKGVWKLTDLNTDGDCNDPGEVNLLWTPPAIFTPFYWSLTIDPVGNVYTTDHSDNEQVWRGNDLNQNGTIEPNEQTLFYQTTGSLWWDVVLRDDGAVLLVEAETPDRITVLRDLNNDGDALDAGEAVEGYDASQAVQAISVRGAALMRAPRLSANPPSVQIGTATSFFTEANKPGDLVVVALSIGPAPAAFALPPWGTVEIDVSAFVILGLGLAGPNGNHAQPFAVPNSLSAVGAWAVQSLAGDSFRLFLSNPASLLITP